MMNLFLNFEDNLLPKRFCFGMESGSDYVPPSTETTDQGAEASQESAENADGESQKEVFDVKELNNLQKKTRDQTYGAPEKYGNSDSAFGVLKQEATNPLEKDVLGKLAAEHEEAAEAYALLIAAGAETSKRASEIINSTVA